MEVVSHFEGLGFLEKWLENFWASQLLTLSSQDLWELKTKTLYAPI